VGLGFGCCGRLGVAGWGTGDEGTGTRPGLGLARGLAWLGPGVAECAGDEVALCIMKSSKDALPGAPGWVGPTDCGDDGGICWGDEGICWDDDGIPWDSVGPVILRNKDEAGWGCDGAVEG
jgi:hypothetical protein